MPRGRKPKPRIVRLLEGNPGKRRLPPDIRPTGRAEMPAQLVGEAAAEWARVVPGLAALGLATDLDRAALTAYCVSWARWMESEAALATEGRVTRGVEGSLVASPWVAIAREDRKSLREFAVEFGMTPAARTRVKVDETRVPSKATGTDGKAPGRFFRE